MLKMPASEEFQKYKTLYYEDNLPVVDVSYNSEQTIITFKDGDSKIRVSGTSKDFADLPFQLVPTVRNGVEQLIEVNETAVDSAVEYYENMDLFSPESDEPIDEAAKRLREGKTEIPEQLDWREALSATVQKEIDNPELQKVIRNYHETLAVVRSDKYKRDSVYAKIRRDKPYDTETFYKYYTQSITILEKHYLSLSEFEAYKKFVENCETDIEYFSSNLLEVQKMEDIEWSGLSNREPNKEDGVIVFQEKQRQDGRHSKEKGEVELEIGIRKILDQYADLFEIAREPLRDIAITLDKKNRDLSHTTPVLRFLKSNKAQTFPQAVEPEMRHGSAHNQIKLNDKEKEVEFFDGRGKGRNLITRIDYKEIPQHYYELYDMIIALLISFSKVWHYVCYQYLGSKEFQFRVLEQIDPNFE